MSGSSAPRSTSTARLAPRRRASPPSPGRPASNGTPSTPTSRTRPRSSARARRTGARSTRSRTWRRARSATRSRPYTAGTRASKEAFSLFLRDSALYPDVWAKREEHARRGREGAGGAIRPRRAVRAAVGHAVAFETWQSLVRREGLSSRQAAAAMVAFVEAVATGASRPLTTSRDGRRAGDAADRRDRAVHLAGSPEHQLAVAIRDAADEEHRAAGTPDRDS